MNVNVSFIILPLDAVSPISSPHRFALNIVTEYDFAEGHTYSQSELLELVDSHPLLQGTKDLIGHIWEYDKWIANSKVIDKSRAQQIKFEYSDKERDEKLNVLRSLIAGSQSSKKTKKTFHDNYQDKLKESDYVDVAKTYDEAHELVSYAKARMVSMVKSAEPSLLGQGDANSVLMSSHLNSVIQSSLLKLVDLQDFESLSRIANVSQEGFDPNDFFKSIRKLENRLDAASKSDKNYRKTANSVVDQKDLNTIVKSSLKNTLLASSSGLVTKWDAILTSKLELDKAYVVQIDMSSLESKSSNITLNESLPTVFCRSTHTHPLAFKDLSGYREGNTGLAYLNTSSGRFRFRATTVNIEQQISKQFILQRRNSLAEVGSVIEASQKPGGIFVAKLDDRPPEVLAGEQYGLAEPETSGATISAPVEDILVHKNLRFSDPKTRIASYPCYFLDDLVIGYRLDLKELDDGESEYLSVHKEEQDLTLFESGKSVRGWTETYFEREQSDDPKYETTSTEITTYTGMSASQRIDYPLRR